MYGTCGGLWPADTRYAGDELLEHIDTSTHKVCRDSHSVLHQRAPKLFPKLVLAHDDGRYGRMTRTLGRLEVLALVHNPSGIELLARAIARYG